MKAGDLVKLTKGDWTDEWPLHAKQKLLLFWRWCDWNDGWAELIYPDGSKKIVHADYMIKVEKT